MIDRYSLPEMAAVFADTTRFGRYLEIELLATEAQASWASCRRRMPRLAVPTRPSSTTAFVAGGQ